MSAYFPEIASFLGAYFHQDWASEYPSMEAAVKDFQERNPVDFQIAVRDELQAMMAMHYSEEVIEKVLYEMGCYLAPDAFGMNNTQWLEWLLARLSEKKTGIPERNANDK